jgi:drug/metabolite transporter (DMT)-like permease
MGISISAAPSNGQSQQQGSGKKQPMLSQLQPFVPLILLLLVGSFFGGTTVNGKFASLAGWSPTLFLAISSVGGGLLMVLAFSFFNVSLKLDRRVLAYSVLSGILFALPNIAFFTAVPQVGAGFVALVTAFASVLTYVFSIVLRLEKFGIRRGLGVLVALIGALTLSLGKLTGGQLSPIWVLVALSGPVMLAIGNIYRSQYWPKGASPFTLAPLMLIFAGLFSGAAAAMQSVPLVGVITYEMWWPLIAQIVIFALGFSFYFVLQQRAGAVYLSQIGPVIALVGTILGATLLDEIIDLPMALGGVAIIAGVLIFNWAQGRKRSS